MKTPTIMLFLMTMPVILAYAFSSFTQRKVDLRVAAAVGLALLFAFTGLGHFIRTAEMAQMLPSSIPGRVTLVQLTGLLEFAIAAGFLFRATRRLAGIIAAAVLVLFFPVNVYAAIQHVPFGGHEIGPAYLLLRGPLQLAILAFVYGFTIRRAPFGSGA